MKPKIIQETPITVASAKEELEKIKEREKELNFRAKKTLEYMEQFAILPSKDVKELEKELAKVPRLKEQHIAKLIDLLPKTAAEAKTALQNEAGLTNETLQKVAETIAKFAK